MTELQQQIEETISNIVHLEKVESQLKITRTELADVGEEINKLERILQEELRNIEELEGLSTRAIFHKILGNKEQQLEEERQEYLEMNLKLEDHNNRSKLLEYEISLLEAKLGNREALEQKLESLKQERETEIIRSDPELRSTLLKVSENLEFHFRLKKELQEAIEVGSICHNLTSQVISHLQKVRNWGSWQGQHHRRRQRRRRRDAIDRARNITYQVKHHLHLFDRELKDLGKKLTFGIDEEVLTNFTEFFFDNLITDWILQQKVTKALGAVNHTKRQLAHLVDQLKNDLQISSDEIKDLRNRREEILTS